MSFAALRSMDALFLTDACTITTPGAGPRFDPELEVTVDEVGVEVYVGRCLVMSGGGRNADVGDASVPIGAYDIRLPWDTTGIEVDQVVTIDESSHPFLEGLVMRITEIRASTEGGDLRLICDSPTSAAQFEEGE